MRNLLVILSLILFAQNAFAVEKVYINQPSPYSGIYQRSLYNPYGYNNAYYTPYRYRRTNYSDAKRIQRINRLRNLNRIRNNFLTWNFNRNPGVLSGYSVPINKNVYSQVGLDPWDTNYNKHAPNCTTDLFSTPLNNSNYGTKGYLRNDNGGLSNKAGVRIIYD